MVMFCLTLLLAPLLYLLHTHSYSSTYIQFQLKKIDKMPPVPLDYRSSSDVLRSYYGLYLQDYL